MSFLMKTLISVPLVGRIRRNRVGENHEQLDLVKDRQERDTWDSVDDEPMNETGATLIDEDLHMVLLNKEYTGDSILENLSSTGGTRLIMKQRRMMRWRSALVGTRKATIWLWRR
ncbi:hypothetical protein L1987_16567 [Smallanthus sonchifolius]|uniref:Uncharacterized protein n=1 Tax=Smallanthus sonchifolius TaxID=185202 RepID=A0ACB9IWJ5_9ASTR|nr:hypothetical protein L1987_16567 [Smallanthus sonchifolius]